MKSAILLVGGFGTRLQPLTLSTPKPMLPVGGLPFTEHQIIKARDAGITEIVLATSFMAEVFEPYFGNGERFGIDIAYAVEEVALGTGGAIANAAKSLKNKGPVIIFNGDVLSGHDLQAQMQLHTETGADVTLYLTEVSDARAYGVVEMDGHSIRTFNEKMENPPTKIINAGCYIFNREIMNYIPEGRVVSIERETFPHLLSIDRNITGFVDNSYWLDIGTPSALRRATSDLISGNVLSGAFDELLSRGTYIHTKESMVSTSAIVAPGVVLMDGSFVSAHAIVDGGSQLFGTFVGESVHVGADSQLVDSFIATGTKIPAGCIAANNFFGYADQ
jgi:mannose-1-phosphate guanylyltransferase